MDPLAEQQQVETLTTQQSEGATPRIFGGKTTVTTLNWVANASLIANVVFVGYSILKYMGIDLLSIFKGDQTDENGEV